jgi:chromosome segregation ATPase
MQTMQVEYSGKIEKDRQEAEGLIKELEVVRAENVTAEEDQMAVLDSIATVERDVYSACHELHELRMQCNSVDLQNMDIKKQIDSQEFLIGDGQNVALAQCQKIKEQGEYFTSLTVECSEQIKRIDTLNIEVQMNNDNIKSASELLATTTEKSNQTHVQIIEAETEINKQREVLMKLDEELNFMETCTENHKKSQSYMLERVQKETAAV